MEIKVEGYLGGPADKLLLVNYEKQVTRQLWDGVVSNEDFISLVN